MIKTKEVIKNLKIMNLQTKVCGDCLVVLHCGGGPVASVNLAKKFDVDVNYWDFENKLTEFEQERVFVLLTRLAVTDPEDREEEKKYYLKHKWIGTQDFIYLNLNFDTGSCFLGSKSDLEFIKTQFSQSEIDGFKKTNNTNLEDFEIVEVEDDR